MSRGSHVWLYGHCLVIERGRAPGRCTCGVESDRVLSGFGKQQWHREHKIELKGRR